MNTLSSQYTNITSQDYQQRDPMQLTQEADPQKENQDKAIKNPDELKPDERQLVADLQARDTEVKAHEAAHQAAGGGLAGGASFSYQQGPDGKMYAIGGEVPISIKGGSTPQEQMANARQVQAAAMAPANPSGQDYAVASSARVMEMKAQQELKKQRQEENYAQETYKQSATETTQTETQPQKEGFDISA